MSSGRSLVRWVVLVALAIGAILLVPPSDARADCIGPRLEPATLTIEPGQQLSVTAVHFTRDCNDTESCTVDAETGEDVCSFGPPERPISPVDLVFLEGGRRFPVASFDNDRVDFTREITVPEDLPAGEARLVLSSSGYDVVDQNFTVTSTAARVTAPDELAETGTPAWTLVLLASGLFVTGLGLRWRRG